MSKTFKRYAISSLVTFLTGFCVVVLPLMNDITMDTLKNGAYVGIVVLGVRAGIKALMEYFLATRS